MRNEHLLAVSNMLFTKQIIQSALESHSKLTLADLRRYLEEDARREVHHYVSLNSRKAEEVILKTSQAYMRHVDAT